MDASTYFIVSKAVENFRNCCLTDARTHFHKKHALINNSCWQNGGIIIL